MTIELLQAAQKAVREKHYDEGLALAEKVLVEDADNINALIIKAASLQYLRKFGLALISYRNILKLKPEHRTTWRGIVSLFESERPKKPYDEMLKACAVVIEDAKTGDVNKYLQFLVINFEVLLKLDRFDEAMVLKQQEIDKRQPKASSQVADDINRRIFESVTVSFVQQDPALWVKLTAKAGLNSEYQKLLIKSLSFAAQRGFNSTVDNDDAEKWLERLLRYFLIIEMYANAKFACFSLLRQAPSNEFANTIPCVLGLIKQFNLRSAISSSTGAGTEMYFDDTDLFDASVHENFPFPEGVKKPAKGQKGVNVYVGAKRLLQLLNIHAADSKKAASAAASEDEVSRTYNLLKDSVAADEKFDSLPIVQTLLSFIRFHTYRFLLRESRDRRQACRAAKRLMPYLRENDGGGASDKNRSTLPVPMPFGKDDLYYMADVLLTTPFAVETSNDKSSAEQISDIPSFVELITQSAAKMFHGSGYAECIRALLLYHQGKYVEAKPELLKAREYDDEQPLFLILYANIYMESGAMTSKNLEDAMKKLRHLFPSSKAQNGALADDDNTPARVLHISYRQQERSEEYELLLARYLVHAEHAYDAAGVILKRLYENNSAAAASGTVKLNPVLVKTMSDFLSLSRDDEVHQFVLADAINSGALLKQQRNFYSVIISSQHHRWAWLRLANLKVRAGKFNDAVTLLQDLLADVDNSAAGEVTDDSQAILLSLADAYYARGSYESAAKFYEQTLSLLKLLNEKSVSSANEDTNENAKLLFTKARNTENLRMYAQYKSGMTLMALGRFDECHTALQQCRSSSNKSGQYFTPALVALAQCQLQLARVQISQGLLQSCSETLYQALMYLSEALTLTRSVYVFSMIAECFMLHARYGSVEAKLAVPKSIQQICNFASATDADDAELDSGNDERVEQAAAFLVDQSESWKLAASFLNVALSLNPNNESFWASLAVASYEQCRAAAVEVGNAVASLLYKQAVKCAKRALHIGRNSIDVGSCIVIWNIAGVIASDIRYGQPKIAQFCFCTAVKLSQEHQMQQRAALPLCNLAALCVRRASTSDGDVGLNSSVNNSLLYSRANALLIRAQGADPRRVEVWLNMSLIARAHNDVYEAMEFLRHCCKISRISAVSASLFIEAVLRMLNEPRWRKLMSRHLTRKGAGASGDTKEDEDADDELSSEGAREKRRILSDALDAGLHLLSIVPNDAVAVNNVALIMEKMNMPRSAYKMLEHSLNQNKANQKCRNIMLLNCARVALRRRAGGRQDSGDDDAVKLLYGIDENATSENDLLLFLKQCLIAAAATGKGSLNALDTAYQMLVTGSLAQRLEQYHLQGAEAHFQPSQLMGVIKVARGMIYNASGAANEAKREMFDGVSRCHALFNLIPLSATCILSMDREASDTLQDELMQRLFSVTATSNNNHKSLLSSNNVATIMLLTGAKTQLFNDAENAAAARACLKEFLRFARAMPYNADVWLLLLEVIVFDPSVAADEAIDVRASVKKLIQKTAANKQTSKTATSSSSTSRTLAIAQHCIRMLNKLRLTPDKRVARAVIAFGQKFRVPVKEVNLNICRAVRLFPFDEALWKELSGIVKN